MIKQFVPQGVCLKCTGCCRFSQLISQWAPVFSEKEIRLQPAKKGDYFVCPLLNEDDNKCRIYTLRPFDCQLYPFLINRKDRKIYLSVDLNCSWAKENLNNQPFKKYLDYLSSLLNSKAYRLILKNNPQLIQTYPEVIDLIEIK